MSIHGRVESFEVVGGTLEIVFSGNMFHASGNGPNDGDHWGFSARVARKKLIVRDAGSFYFFVIDDAKGEQVRNFKDDFEKAREIYAGGHYVLISVYSPEIHFDKGISKVVAETATISMLADTMSNTRPAVRQK